MPGVEGVITGLGPGDSGPVSMSGQCQCGYKTYSPQLLEF